MDPTLNTTQHKIPGTEETTVSCSVENSNTLSGFIPFSKLGDLSHFSDNNDDSDGDKETEPNSFIILGKDSLDAIQASSLASYVDIQQKTMSVDYNTIVSSLPTNEIHQKLTDLLQENTKLKETLKQNNLAMKKQLTTMVSWQEMVMKLHENHMEKFKETTNLISNLKRENLDLKTKLAIQQTEDIEHNFEAIDPIPNSSNSTFSCKAVPQEPKASILEKNKYTLPNDKKSKLAVAQTEVTKDFKVLDIHFNSNFNSNNSNISNLSQEEVSASSVLEEEKYTLSNKQHICQHCDDMKKKKDNVDNVEQNAIKEKSLLENCERQIPYEYSTSNDLFAKLEKSSPAIDQIQKLIYSIKCEMNLVYWNDNDYENNRTRYNNLMSELVKNIVEIIDRCRVLTYCLNNVTPIFAKIEEAINKGTFEKNLELLKQEFAKYKTLAPVYYQLIHPDNDINNLSLTFSDSLQNILEHIRNVFADYWENLNMMYLLMDETLKRTDNAHENDFHDDSQEQTEVQQKLKMLAIQQNKLQKQEKELEEKVHELNLQYELLNNEKHRMQKVDELREQLMRRKNLYDGKMHALLNEKLLFMRIQKINPTDVLEKYKQKTMECEKLQHELDETISEINVYKNQMAVYEEDFKQERKLKESLLEEKDKLDIELQKQVNYNKQLSNNIPSLNGRPSFERTSHSPNRDEILSCPKCEKKFATLLNLTEHIEQCLNLTWNY